MHGGGKRYGRRIEVLTKQNASKQFLERLQCGRLKGQAITSCSSKPTEITSLPVVRIGFNNCALNSANVNCLPIWAWCCNSFCCSDLGAH